MYSVPELLTLITSITIVCLFSDLTASSQMQQGKAFLTLIRLVFPNFDFMRLGNNWAFTFS